MGSSPDILVVLVRDRLSSVYRSYGTFLKAFYFSAVGGLTELPYQLAVGKVRKDGRLIEDF